MATIRPKDLPAASSVAGTAVVPVDTGSTVEKATPAQIVDAAIPLASQVEAETGADNTKRMSALRVKQAMDANMATTAALASTDSGKGAALLGYKSHATGAVARTSKSKHDDTVSIFDFISSTLHTDILNGDHTGDLASQFASALDSGESLYIPGKYKVSKYSIDGTLTFETNWQRVYGDGANLDFIGQDDTANAIDIISTRTSGGASNATREHYGLSGLLLTMSAEAAYDNIIWIEDGVFHAIIENMRFVNQGGGEIANAVLKFDSGSATSYPNGITVRDFVMRGSGHASASTPDPCGVDIEGLIETELQRIKVYDFQTCFRIGSSSVAATLSTVDLIDCHAEIGDRKFVDASGTCLDLIYGTDINWRGGKMNAGNSYASATDQAPVVVTGHATNPLAINILGSELRGTSRCNRAIYVPSTATHGESVRVLDSTFVAFEEGVAEIDSAAACRIDIPIDRNNFIDVVPKMGRVSSRATTHDFGSLADGAGETANLFDTIDHIPTDMPVLLSSSVSLQGMFLTGYFNNTPGRLVTRLQNETGGTIDLASATMRVRALDQRDIKAMAAKTYASGGTVSAGAQATTTVTVPGAKLGDFALVQFKNLATNNLTNSTLLGYVSADNTVTAIFYAGGSGVNFTTGTLRAIVLNPHFDLTGSATYDPASLVDGAGATTTVTVTGAALGDFVVVSFSNDLQGVMMQGHVSAADTVTVRFQNESGGTIDLASGTILVGLYKNATAL